MGKAYVIDDEKSDVMNIARATLKQLKIPVLLVNLGTIESPAYFCWILDQNRRPAIIAGYATDDPEKMSSPHHIIKFHFRKRGIFNVLSTIEDYAVKHTRVATPSIVVYDERIPIKEPKPARDYLEEKYIEHVLNITAAFRARGHDVPPVLPFEEEQPMKRKTAKKIAKLALKKKIKKAKAKAKKKRPAISEEYDEEDGPTRRLTPSFKAESLDESEDEAGDDENDEDDGDEDGGQAQEGATQSITQEKAQAKDDEDDDSTSLFTKQSGIDLSGLGKLKHTEDGDVIFVLDDDDDVVQSVEMATPGPVRSNPRSFNTREHRVQPY